MESVSVSVRRAVAVRDDSRELTFRQQSYHKLHTVHSMESRGPVRGRNDVELATQTTEDDESIEYVDESKSVRYIGGWRRPRDSADDSTDRVPFFESTPFWRWSETKCVKAAARAAADYVNKQLNTDEARWKISGQVTDERRIDAVVWVGAAMDATDGTRIYETTLDFEEVAAETPETVTATYRLGETEREEAVPIYVSFDTLTQE